MLRFREQCGSNGIIATANYSDIMDMVSKGYTAVGRLKCILEFNGDKRVADMVIRFLEKTLGELVTVYINDTHQYIDIIDDINWIGNKYRTIIRTWGIDFPFVDEYRFGEDDMRIAINWKKYPSMDNDVNFPTLMGYSHAAIDGLKDKFSRLDEKGEENQEDIFQSRFDKMDVIYKSLATQLGIPTLSLFESDNIPDFKFNSGFIDTDNTILQVNSDIGLDSYHILINIVNSPHTLFYSNGITPGLQYKRKFEEELFKYLKEEYPDYF